MYSNFDSWFEDLKSEASFSGTYINNAADWEHYYQIGMTPEDAWKEHGNT